MTSGSLFYVPLVPVVVALSHTQNRVHTEDT